MKFSEYQKAAVVTKQKWSNQEGDLANCGLGIAGEAGEVAEIIKKHLSNCQFKGTNTFDDERLENLKYEIGDVMWYVASLCDCLGLDMDEVAEMNINKLRKRHGDSYSGYGKR